MIEYGAVAFLNDLLSTVFILSVLTWIIKSRDDFRPHTPFSAARGLTWRGLRVLGVAGAVGALFAWDESHSGRAIAVALGTVAVILLILWIQELTDGGRDTEESSSKWEQFVAITVWGISVGAALFVLNLL